MSRLICGVGINDVKGNTKSVYHRKWRDMLRRVYKNENHPRDKYVYKGITVCEEWLLFSNFRNWMMTQDWEGKHLDKDALYPDNKVYSPDTCCFITHQLNIALYKRRRDVGKYKEGVYFCKNNKLFRSQISINGIRYKLGYFNTEEEAHKIYIKEKINYIKTFYPQVSKRVKKGLKRHVKKFKEGIK